MAMAQIHFGAGSCIGYSPWHSGDQIHLVASVEPASAESRRHDGCDDREVGVRTGEALRKLLGVLEPRDIFPRASGALDRSAFSAMFERGGVEMNESFLDEAMALIDKNNDGVVDHHEFDAACYAARLAGGVDVYIPCAKKELVTYYESAEFRQILLGSQPADLM
jgi:hypothetical protein